MRDGPHKGYGEDDEEDISPLKEDQNKDEESLFMKNARKSAKSQKNDKNS